MSPAPTNPSGEGTPALTAFDWHKALDRAHCLNLVAHATLEEHQVIKSDPDLIAAFDAAVDAICHLYQLIGQKFPEDK